MIEGQLGATGADEEAWIEMTDMVGRVVYKNHVMLQDGILSEKISLGNEPVSGMYLLTVRTMQENRVMRVVVNR